MPPKLKEGKSYRTVRKEKAAKLESHRESNKKHYRNMSEEQKAKRRERDRLWRQKRRAEERQQKEAEAAKKAEDEEDIKAKSRREQWKLRQARHRAKKKQLLSQDTSEPSSSKTTHRVVLPNSPSKFASSVVKLIDHASPSKKEQLEILGVHTKSSERSAAATVVKATKRAVKCRSTKRALVRELQKEPNKTSVSQILPISRSTLYRKFSGHIGRPTINTQIRGVVDNFFNNPDIITIYPNKRKGKVIAPLKVLNYTKKNLYVKFREKHPDIKISPSTFWKYKPKHIKRMAAARLLQCVCDICENISLITTAIRRSMTQCNLDVGDIFDDPFKTGLLTLCHKNLHFPKCLDRKCAECGTHQFLDLLQQWADDDPSSAIKFATWKVVDTEVNGKVVKRLTKVICSESRKELLLLLESKLKGFGRHVFNARSQLAAYQQCYTTLKEDECCVVVDFSENYTCLRQGEAQSAYYSRNQVTLHPMVMLVPNDGAVIRDSVCGISDDLKHDSIAVKEFLRHLFVHIEIMYPHIRKVHVWSDGAAAQYKSKHPLHHIAQGFHSQFQIVWNFYGSRHGKSAADGEAAVVKTFLSTSSTKNEVILDNAEQVFSYLTESDLHILDGHSRRHFYFVSKSDIYSLRQNCVKKISTVPGTRKIHQVCQGPSELSIKYRSLSCYCSQYPCNHAFNDWKVYTLKVSTADGEALQEVSSEEDCEADVSNADIQFSDELSDGDASVMAFDGQLSDQDFDSDLDSHSDGEEDCDEMLRRFEDVIQDTSVFCADSGSEDEELQWSDWTDATGSDLTLSDWELD